MSPLKPLQGRLITVDFSQAEARGHEQEGQRPAVIAGVPNWLGQPTYQGFLVVPFSSSEERLLSANQHIYPLYLAGTGQGPTDKLPGLTVDSFALTDQLRFVDIRRIENQLGQFSEQEYMPIALALKAMLNL